MHVTVNGRADLFVVISMTEDELQALTSRDEEACSTFVMKVGQATHAKQVALGRKDLRTNTLFVQTHLGAHAVVVLTIDRQTASLVYRKDRDACHRLIQQVCDRVSRLMKVQDKRQA